MKIIAVYVDGAVFMIGHQAMTDNEIMSRMFNNRAKVVRFEENDAWDTMAVIFDDATRFVFTRQRVIIQSKDAP